MGRLFTSDDARAAGLERWHLQGSNVRRVHRDVYVDASVPDSPAFRARAALLALPPGSVLSHHTAAQLRGLPVPEHTAAHAAVRVPIPPRVAGIRAHRLVGDLEVEDVRGLPLTGVARTWLDIAAIVTRIDLVILGDAILRRGLVTQVDLERRAAAAIGRGAPLARAVVPLLEPRTDSPMESRVRIILVDGGLPRPIANQDVFDAGGQWIAKPDLQYPKQRIAIEYEGEHHLTDPRQWSNDIRRDESLHNADWRLVKVTKLDVFRRPDTLVARVADLLAGRGPAV